MILLFVISMKNPECGVRVAFLLWEQEEPFKSDILDQLISNFKEKNNV